MCGSLEERGRFLQGLRADFAAGLWEVGNLTACYCVVGCHVEWYYMQPADDLHTGLPAAQLVTSWLSLFFTIAS